MKLRIIADIHSDINKSKNYQFDFCDDFIVACGDISGDRFTPKIGLKPILKTEYLLKETIWAIAILLLIQVIQRKTR